VIGFAVAGATSGIGVAIGGVVVAVIARAHVATRPAPPATIGG
jgi:hypothetical protein